MYMCIFYHYIWHFYVKGQFIFNCTDYNDRFIQMKIVETDSVKTVAGEISY